MKIKSILTGLSFILLGSSAWAEINVHSATYGRNCGAWTGNATQDVRYRCNNRQNCNYFISVSNLGDPAPGCAKNFDVTYSCGWGQPAKRETVAQEANGKYARLTCNIQPPGNRINVRAATYGLNVGTRYGNATGPVASECNGRRTCNYFISVQILGDPAPGRQKDFRVEYTCGFGGRRFAFAPAEANGRRVRLSCGGFDGDFNLDEAIDDSTDSVDSPDSVDSENAVETDTE